MPTAADITRQDEAFLLCSISVLGVKKHFALRTDPVVEDLHPEVEPQDRHPTAEPSGSLPAVEPQGIG
eukprot:1304974-Amphidinium_carterae.1